MNYAGVMPRIGAWIIDIVLILIIGMVSIFVIALVGHIPGLDFLGSDPIVFLIWIFLLFCFYILYSAYYESSPVQATLGKKYLGLYVTNTSGNQLLFSKACIRAALKFFLVIITPLALITVYFIISSDKKQSIHDKVVESLVLKRTDT